MFSFVDGPGWTYKWFWVSVGVLQPCTASTILFDLAFQLILDIQIASAGQYGFDFHKAKILVSKPIYAYDIALSTNWTAENQISIDIFLDALKWSGCFQSRVKK